MTSFREQQEKKLKFLQKIKTGREIADNLQRDFLERGDKPKVGFESLPTLNAMVWGLQRCNIVASRTSMGKTTLSTQLALDFCLQNIPTIYCSLEDETETICERMFCNMYEVNNMDLRTGLFRISEDIMKKWDGFKDKFEKFPLLITCGIGKTMDETIAFIEELPQAKVFILDYIQNTSSGKNEREAIQEYVRKFRETMIEFDLYGIVCSQINRTTVMDKETRKPDITGLRGSGSLEETADTVFLLHYDYWWTNDEEKKNDFEIRVAKNKKGATGTFKCQYFPQFCKFREYPKIGGDNASGLL